VTCSRARSETRLYFADPDHAPEPETPMRQPDPAGPPERVARALARPVAEPLAHDQHPDRRDSVVRMLAHQQEQLDRQRERTADRLLAAQYELHDLHWWNRGHRAELATEIAFHRTALERADRKQEQLRDLAEQRTKNVALASQRGELTRSHQLEPPRRTPANRLERGFGLER
jgi:hypothetical protein